MIYHALSMSLEKRRLDDATESMKNYHFNKRNITAGIENIKQEVKIIKSFDIVPTQEHLYDISERIKVNISEIRHHLESLAFVNETLLNYTDSQIEIAKYLKNNCYATKILYSVIEKKRIFGKLNDVDPQLKQLFEHEVNDGDVQHKGDSNKIISLNPQDPSFIKENHEENILAHNVPIEDIRNHFDIIFTKERSNAHKNSTSRKETAKTLQQLEFHKIKNDKIKKHATSKLNNSVSSSGDQSKLNYF